MRHVDVSKYKAELRVLDDSNSVVRGRYVGKLRVPDGPDMYTYVHLRPADVLRVHFHGAFLASDTYPRFDRLRSAEVSGDAYLSISDPTISVHEAVSLGWYLGGDGWDPMDTICDLIRRAAEVSGATQVVLIGGSGGGYAALRAGLRMPDALVYCFNPQTAVLNYYGGHVGRYFAKLYGADVIPTEIAVRDPERFDVVAAYGAASSTPAVFYAQNLTDSFHIERHYIPFKRALGVTSAEGSSAIVPRICFYLFDGEGKGHKPPNAADFDAQLKLAMQWQVDGGGNAEERSDSLTVDEDQWSSLFAELARLRREVAAIQSGEHSSSLRRHIVADLMGVMAMREGPIDRRPVLSGWAMSPVALRSLLRIVEDAPKGSRVVEFGSGASTAWIADVVARRNGELDFTSYEHDARYFDRTRKELQDAGLASWVDLQLSELQSFELDGEMRPWYSEWAGEVDVSLALVDGPPGGLRPMARFPAIAYIEARVMDGGIVVVDDFARDDEQSMVERWNVLSPTVRLSHVETVDRSGVFRVDRR